MKRLRGWRKVAAGVLCVSITGCISVTVSSESSVEAECDGLLNGYATCNGIRPYDGTLIEAGCLSFNDRWGDVVSLDIWPIGGVGVGLIGAQVKLLPFEAGIGLLGYDPQPEVYTHQPSDECTCIEDEMTALENDQDQLEYNHDE